MSASHIHSRYRTVPASLLLDTLGKSLSTIKDEDRATDADLGQVLGKSEDRAGAYRAGAGDMGVVKGAGFERNRTKPLTFSIVERA